MYAVMCNSIYTWWRRVLTSTFMGGPAIYLNMVKQEQHMINRDYWDHMENMETKHT